MPCLWPSICSLLWKSTLLCLSWCESLNKRIIKKKWPATSDIINNDPDQTPQIAEYDQDLNCLLTGHAISFKIYHLTTCKIGLDSSHWYTGALKSSLFWLLSWIPSISKEIFSWLVRGVFIHVLKIMHDLVWQDYFHFEKYFLFLNLDGGIWGNMLREQKIEHTKEGKKSKCF